MAASSSLASPPEPGSAEHDLLAYLEESYQADFPLSLEHIDKLLSRISGPLDWPLRHEEDMPCIHFVIMNEATPALDAQRIVSKLLEAGADPLAIDGDKDNALQTLMALSEDAEREREELEQDTKIMHLAIAFVLVSCPRQTLGDKDVMDIVSWMSRYMPSSRERSSVRKALEARVGKGAVSKAWASEQLFAYFERSAYEEKADIKAPIVLDLLAKGACPRQSRNGATCFLLSVLNPYSKYEHLKEAYDAMLRKDPEVATIRDGFGMTAVNWASGYRNIAQQHNMKTPNPAAILALIPSICENLPADMDATESCFKVSPDGVSGEKRRKSCPPPSQPLRFLEGDKVLCRVEAPGLTCEWEEGIVIGLWYRESCWPRSHPGAPYEVRLDIGAHVYAIVDHDRIIRRYLTFRPPVRTAAAAGESGALGSSADKGTGAADAKAAPANGKSEKASSSPRFVRRQKEDGSWEMYDTVSGKARPTKAPDSDDDSD